MLRLYLMVMFLCAWMINASVVLSGDVSLSGFPAKIEVKASSSSGPVDSNAKDQGKEDPAIVYELHRNGVGLCEWGFFEVDLYRAALYLERKCSRPEMIIESKGAKRIHLVFVRSLTREQLQKAYGAAFEANAKRNLEKYKKRIDLLKNMMTDVSEGDSLIFTYLPEEGVEVRIKGKVRGTIKGEDFASKFFELYLGKHPPTKELKAGLLGLREEEG